MRKERFEAFTDAVLSIILTILILDIKLPSNSDTLSSLMEMGPKFIAYVVTFISIATLWVNHHFYLYMFLKSIIKFYGLIS